MNRSRRSILVILFALAVVPLAAKPNFSGEWKLNLAKSDFGEMPAPSSVISKISHEEPNLKNAVKQVSDFGEMEFTSSYTTDGKECTNEFFGNPMTSVLSWDGDALIIKSKASFGGNDFTMEDKWTLSEGDKILTIERSFKGPMGEGKQRLVFEKQ